MLGEPTVTNRRVVRLDAIQPERDRPAPTVPTSPWEWQVKEWAYERKLRELELALARRVACHPAVGEGPAPSKPTHPAFGPTTLVPKV